MWLSYVSGQKIRLRTRLTWGCARPVLHLIDIGRHIGLRALTNHPTISFRHIQWTSTFCVCAMLVRRLVYLELNNHNTRWLQPAMARILPHVYSIILLRIAMRSIQEAVPLHKLDDCYVPKRANQSTTLGISCLGDFR
jgi:hypothetical protein